MKSATHQQGSSTRRGKARLAPGPAALPGLRRADATEVEDLARLGRLIGPVTRGMRAPAAALVAASEVLAEHIGPNHPYSGFARLIRHESARIHETMSDLAALALPLKLAPRFINVLPLLDELLERFRHDVELYGVRFSTAFPAGPIDVWADPGALRSANAGLIRHALVAMQFGGTLHLSAGRVRTKSAPMACILFADTGPQVPEELLPNIFEPFAAMEGRRPGMSLALCRRIVEHLGGSVEARNNTLGGLTVEVRLKSRV